MKDYELIELGVASTETKGVAAPNLEDAFGIPQLGLSDD